MKSTIIRILYYLTCILALLLPPNRVFGQIYHVQEMNTEQIKALDREKTVVLLPVGILEEHGPFLPSGSDIYITDRRTSELANALVERPGWKVLIFPVIPLGTGPANTVGRKYVFPGSYTVRPATLRAIFMDLATDLGEQGFRWIFIVNAHLGVSHNRILNQAGDYFRDTYGGHMVNLAALIYRPPGQSQTRSEEEQREDAGSTHAGASETSLLLYFRPELVSPGYKNARQLPYRDQKQRIEIARATDWPGYWGSPRLATAAAAAARWKDNSSRLTELAHKILDGFDYSQMKRRGDEVVVGEPAGEITFTQHNQQIESRQQEWLKKKGIE
jgi:creatinine amidohydrolase/Fe(II)-dependent formamide hydrolase-like protein